MTFIKDCLGASITFFTIYLHHFFMGGRGMFERVHVGSYSYYVENCILIMGFYSHYGDCYRRRVGCYSRYVGCPGTMWDVSASVWYIVGAKGAATGTERALE